MTGRIDLNADLGEECGDDAAMLAVVTSASLAGGGHAGGGVVLARAIAAASAAGVAIGAHPSYPDRAGFGRTSLASSHGPGGVRRIVVEQVETVVAACSAAGVALTHVKAHGALYGDVAGAVDLAEEFVDAVIASAGAVAVLGPAGSVLERACRDRGIRLVAEGFADRAYGANGRLVPRARSGAVHVDPARVAAQAVALATGGPLLAIDGSPVIVRAESLCIHGDTPGAVDLARRTRAALEAAGLRITAPWT